MLIYVALITCNTYLFLFNIYYSISTILYLLFYIYYSISTIQYLLFYIFLFNIYYSISTIQYLLFYIYYSISTIQYLLFYIFHILKINNQFKTIKKKNTEILTLYYFLKMKKIKHFKNLLKTTFDSFYPAG